MPARLSPFSALGKRGACLAVLLGFSLVLPRVRALPAQPVPAKPVSTQPGKLGEQAGPNRKTLLQTGTLDQLAQACQQAVAEGDVSSVQLLQLRLMAIKPAPQPLAVVLANADGLLTCQAPDLALQVLARYSPAPGPDRAVWLSMQWRAASAGLHHQLAADALQQLASGQPKNLDARLLPVQEKDDGTVLSRSALDLLAGHLESLGRNREAAELLLASSQGGVPLAERYGRAVALLDALPIVQRQRLIEIALDQAAAAGSWGLVAELLDQQLALETGSGRAATKAMQRRLRLSGRIDDAYGEWLVRHRDQLAQDPSSLRRRSDLELQLRSPRAAGGHAASPQPQPKP